MERWERWDRWLRAVRVAGAAALLGVATAAGAQVVKIDSTFGSVDGAKMVRYLTVTAADIPDGFSSVLTTVTAALDFDKYNVDPTGAPFYSDIGFTLTSPGGKVVTLVSPGDLGPGSDGDFFSGILTFSDAAPTTVNAIPNTLVPGTYRPVGPDNLGMFRGGNAIGTWTLSIEDIISGTEFGESGDPLDYYGAILTLGLKPLGPGDPPSGPPPGGPPPGDPQSTPEPGPTALAAAGAAVGALLARKPRRPRTQRE